MLSHFVLSRSDNVHPEVRGQGIAIQAVRMLVNHLFDATPTERIEARFVVGNEVSCRQSESAPKGQAGGIYF